MQQTFPQYFTTDPVFEQGFVFLVVNPDADDLVVKILDTKHKEKEIASAVVRVSDIIKKPGMNFKKQPVTLKVGSFFVVGENVASVALLQGRTSDQVVHYLMLTSKQIYRATQHLDSSVDIKLKVERAYVGSR